MLIIANMPLGRLFCRMGNTKNILAALVFAGAAGLSQAQALYCDEPFYRSRYPTPEAAILAGWQKFIDDGGAIPAVLPGNFHLASDVPAKLTDAPPAQAPWGLQYEATALYYELDSAGQIISQRWRGVGTVDCLLPVNATIEGASRVRTAPTQNSVPQAVKLASYLGAPVSNQAVTVRLASGAALNGVTNSQGLLNFYYRPPQYATRSKLTVTCDTCHPTDKTITVVAPQDQTCPFGNPIRPATAEKIKAETDWTDAAPHPLTLVRHYSSAGELPAAGLGPNWTHAYAGAIDTAEGGKERTVKLGDSSRHLFTLDPTGTVWLSENTIHQLIDTAAGPLFIRGSDDTRWQFDASGKLIAVTERNGWTRTLSYAGNLLKTVTNAFGRSVTLNHDAQGRLTGVLTSDGQQIAYTFNAAGALTAVVLPGGATRSYVYENAQWPYALTGLVNELGQRLETYTYDTFGRATSTSRADGVDRFEIAYGPISGTGDGFAPDPDTPVPPSSVQVKDPLGAMRTYSYQGGQGSLHLQAADAPRDGDAVANRTFHSSGLPLTETDFLGALTTFSWDLSRQLMTARTRAANRPEAQTVNMQWHPGYRLPVLVTEAGRTTAYAYDNRGNLLSQAITDTASGNTRNWQWTYNSAGLADTLTDPLGRVTRYQYDGVGNLTRLTNPAGHVTQLAYDAAGRVTTAILPTGAVVANSYDSRGRITGRQTTPSGGGAPEVETYTWRLTGELASATLANGVVYSYTYDDAQRLTRVTDSAGNAVVYGLDAMGNRISTTYLDPSGNPQRVRNAEFNALNRIRLITDAANRQIAYLEYDANAETIGQSDGLGQRTGTTRDGLRRPVATQFADGATASLSYNSLDQLTSATDPKGVQTAYTVDALGNVRATASPDAGASSADYDAAGNLTRATNALGQTTQYQYDGLNRLTRITWADGQQANFSYDGSANATGKLTRMEDPEGATDYAWDGFGRLAARTQALKNGASQTVRYTYSAGGELASITYPSGKVVAYTRQAGRVTDISIDGAPFVSGVTYTGLNAPKGWDWASGDSATRTFDNEGRIASSELASYTYDAAGRITAIEQNLYMPVTTSTFALGVSKFKVDYDSRNRITRMERDLPAPPAPDPQQQQRPKDPGQSAQVQPLRAAAAADNPNAPTARFAESETFSYDANGNRTSKTEVLRLINQTTGTLTTALTTQRDSRLEESSNRLLGFDQIITQTNARGVVQSSASLGVNYALDAAGNQLGDGLKQYEHDASGRLAKLSYLKSGERMSVLYLHNAQGQRVFKSEPVADDPATIPDTMDQSFIDWLHTRFAWLFQTTRKNDKTKLGTAFVYEGTDLMGEYGTGGAKSTGSTEYIYLPTDGGNILVGAIINGEKYAVHTDHLNTPRRMIDAANQPVWQWSYSAFGDNEPTIAARNFKDRSWAFAKGDLTDLQDGVDNADNGPAFTKKMVKLNLRYPGQYFDDESNLYYNGFRTYCSDCGRYTQSDRIGLAGGWNPFLYVEGNPLSLIDPTGLAGESHVHEIFFGPYLAESGSTYSPGGGAGGRISSSSHGSNSARREAMRDAGIPTSQQPVSQSRNGSGREYSYDVPAPGGGTQRMSTQQQTMDRSHPGRSHWEAGPVKMNPDGTVRYNRYGCPALQNGKSKVDY